MSSEIASKQSEHPTQEPRNKFSVGLSPDAPPFCIKKVKTPRVDPFSFLIYMSVKYRKGTNGLNPLGFILFRANSELNFTWQKRKHFRLFSRQPPWHRVNQFGPQFFKAIHTIRTFSHYFKTRMFNSNDKNLNQRVNRPVKKKHNLREPVFME